MGTKAYELLNQVKNLCLLDATDTTHDTRLLQMMNLVQKQIYNARDNWRDMQTVGTLATTTSVEYVATSSDMAMIYSVRQTSHSPYTKLTFVPPGRFHDVIPQPTAYSIQKPTHYTWWYGRLYMYPIPDAAYTLTVYYYKRPTDMKIYTTGTVSSFSGTLVLGSSTAWATNTNVDTNMFLAIAADTRSDGSFPWSTISSVSGAATLNISTAYTGGGTTGAYVCSSQSSFGVDFDLLLIYGTVIMFGARNRELTDTLAFLKLEYDRLFKELVRTQERFPDWQPEVKDFQNAPIFLGDYEAKFPFIRSNL